MFQAQFPLKAGIKQNLMKYSTLSVRSHLKIYVRVLIINCMYALILYIMKHYHML